MKLVDVLSGESLKKLALDTTQRGDVFRITMTPTEGITPKSGDVSRDKFFILLGVDSEGNVYGGVIINSKINQRLPSHIKDLHMPLKKEKYPFLRYDSFVDCSILMTVSIRKFREWKYLGKILDDDVELIIGAIRESPKETKAHLSVFGL